MPELRKDPVTEGWVIIAGDRARRPRDFVREPVPAEASGLPCPYCAGNEAQTAGEVLAYRHGSGRNQPGWSLRVVPSKLPVLTVESTLTREGEGMFDRMEGVGAHEIVIESPEHVLSMAALPEAAIEATLRAFRERIMDLRNDHRLRYVLLFRNYGEAAGAEFEHTHSQLIALPVVPRRVQEEMKGAKRYFRFKERCVYCDMVRQESKAGTRVVTETDDFLVVSPYAPRFPFETWIIPKRHDSHYESTDPSRFANLAWLLKTTLRKLEKVLENPAYNLFIHTAPLQDSACPHYHWHIEIIPKLTRSAGFEWGTGFYINPTPPEEAAQFLRAAGLG